MVLEDLAISHDYHDSHEQLKNFLEDLLVVKEFFHAGEYRYLKKYRNISPKILLSWNINSNFFQDTEIIDHIINNSDDVNAAGLLYTESLKKGYEKAFFHIARPCYIKLDIELIIKSIDIIFSNCHKIKTSSIIKIFEYLLACDDYEICNIQYYRKIFGMIIVVLLKKVLDQDSSESVLRILLEHLEKKKNVAEIFTEDFQCKFSNVEVLKSFDKYNNQCFPVKFSYALCLLNSDKNEIIKKCIDMSISVSNNLNPRHKIFCINMINISISRNPFTKPVPYIIERLENIDEENLLIILSQIFKSKDIMDYEYVKFLPILQALLELDKSSTCNIFKYREFILYCIFKRNVRLLYLEKILLHLEKKENVAEVFSDVQYKYLNKTTTFYKRLIKLYDDNMITDDMMIRMIKLSVPIDSKTSEFKIRMEKAMKKNASGHCVPS